MEKTICTVAKSFQFSLGNRGKAGEEGSIAPVKNEAGVANGVGNEDAIRRCRGGRAEREAEAEAEAEAKSQRSHK